MVETPASLVYYGSFKGALQILKHRSLPLFKAEDMRDPFLPSSNSQLGFDCQELYERAVKYMTAAIFGKSPPNGNPNHPLQRAIRRWRSEDRFSDEAEIRESLVGLLPAMVEQSYNNAKDILNQWLDYVENKRLLPLYASASDANLWLLEGEHYSGVAVKFKCDSDSIFGECLPVKYSPHPAKPMDMDTCMKLMVGELQELEQDNQELLLTQNYQFRKQKEWRLIVEREEDDEFCLDFPIELLQSVYIGVSVPTEEAEKIYKLAKELNPSISVFKGVCSQTGYQFHFEKMDLTL